MQRTPRQLRLDRALAAALSDSAPYLLPAATLREEITLRVTPRATATEAEEAIRHADGAGRLTSIQAESGAKYKLNEVGQAWAAENL
jgi:hypothetical protein